MYDTASPQVGEPNFATMSLSIGAPRDFLRWWGGPVALALVAVVSLANFLKSLPFQLVEFDAFQYLGFSKAIWSGREIWTPPIRSPVVALVIIPHLLAARFTMVVCHIGVSALLYVLGRRLFETRASPLFASLAYGVSWWMLVFQTAPLTDLPGLVLFLLGLVLWLKAARQHAVLSGVLFGLAVLIRFDLLVLVAPLIVLTPKGLKRYLLIPLVCIAGPLEFVLDVLVYKRIVYVPWEFVQTNLATFVAGREVFFRANQLTLGPYAPRDLFQVGKTLVRLFPLLAGLSLFSLLAVTRSANRLLLCLFVPWFLVVSYVQPFEPRVSIVKCLPLLALLAASVFGMVDRASISATVRRGITGMLFAVLLVGSVAQIAQLTYQPRQFDRRDCVTGRVCSNFAPAVEYYCGVKTSPLVPTADTMEAMRRACDYLFYFKDISGYTAAVDSQLRQSAELLSENTAARVYKLR